MLRNFFVITWRNLIRNRTFSLLNISGLTIGMAAALLIFLWVKDELTYNHSFKQADRIYTVWNRYTIDGKPMCWNVTPKVMAKVLQQDYPEIGKVARVNFSSSLVFNYLDKQLSAEGNIVDSSFLDIFSFPVIKGNAANPLHDNYSMIVTRSFARKLFGDEEPVGKVLKVDNKENFTVTAVVDDPPANSSFRFSYLLPWSVLRMQGADDEFWGNNSTTTYVKLKHAASLAVLEPKLKTLRAKYDEEEAAMETFLYPFVREYLYGRFENGKEAGGRIEYVRLFIGIGILILLVACINFMNLSTARSEKRAREVGVRKVVGSSRWALISQFLGESVLLALISSLLALVIVQLSLPAFNGLVGKLVALPLESGLFWSGLLLFVFITGTLAGSYPALYLSSFRPVKVIKGTFRSVQASLTPRKVLVVAQFTFAILLIIATLVIRLQIQKAQDRTTGYNKDNLLYYIMEGDAENKLGVIRNELMATGLFESITKTSSPVTEGWSNTWGIDWPGKDPNDHTVFDRFCADQQVTKTLGLQLVSGRDIDPVQYPADSNAALVNEAAVKHMGLKNPIGQTMGDMGQQWTIVGVVKDFILSSPYRPVAPMFIAGPKGFFSVLHFRIRDNRSVGESVEVLEKVFKKHNPAYPFNYRFSSEEYSRKFDNEKRTAKLATLFAVLTIVISCLGLFGLASYMAENRVKEIGVRKVLGASVAGIARLLSADFLKLVAVSFLIAAPLGYWTMYKWLQQYPYRTEIHWWIFLLAGLGAGLIALLTVSYQAIRAARSNPVKSLRSE